MKNIIKEKWRYIILAIVAVAIIGAIITQVIIQKEKQRAVYDHCVDLALEGNWWDTIDTFRTLSKSNYEASSTFYDFCTALKYYDEGNIEDAHEVSYRMPFKGLTHEQRVKILEHYDVINDAYERKYGVRYPLTPTPSSGSSNNSSSHSGSSTGSQSNFSSGSHSSSTEDPYNISDYDDVDDFYDDYYYDFEDFDEAEMYWDDHH